MSFRGFPFFIAIAIYCYEGAGMILALETSLGEEVRHKFKKFFITAMTVVTLLYITFGACGYLSFGPETKSIITLNLPKGTGFDFGMMVKSCLCLGIFFTYPVMMFPVIKLLENYLLPDAGKSVWKANLLRFCLVVLTGFVVLAVANFANLKALMGLPPHPTFLPPSLNCQTLCPELVAVLPGGADRFGFVNLLQFCLVVLMGFVVLAVANFANLMALNLLRFCLVVLTGFVVLAVPNFANLMALVGASCCTLLAFILPGIFHMNIFRGSLTRSQMMLDWFLVFVGVFGTIVGTLDALKRLSEDPDSAVTVTTTIENTSSAATSHLGHALSHANTTFHNVSSSLLSNQTAATFNNASSLAGVVASEKNDTALDFMTKVVSKGMQHVMGAGDAGKDASNSRHLLDHEREDNHKEDVSEDKSKNDKQESQLKEDAEDTVEDVDDFLHKLQNSRKGNLGFLHGLISSLSVIIVSELGDKTFFIAAILAMRHSRVTVLLGALSALFVMTIMSALVGYATTVIPRAFTYYASSVLFAIFGLKMLKEAWSMSADEGQEEYEEAQAEIKKKEDELLRQNAPVQDMESGIIRTPGRHFLSGFLSTIFLESFTLTFLAEWGDRSQIATIILGAREDVFGVVMGGLVGHGLCTGLAVVGGRFIAQRISIRTVTFIGAIVFLLFAASALVFGPES
ncbi:hypothetical protein ACOMHN_011296 [Nucella lapillus]